MSAETLEFHHDKHHKAYLDAMTPMIEGTEYASMSIEDIVTKSYSDNPKLFNQAGQYYNHLHFWNWMKPNGGGRSLPGRLSSRSPATSARSTSSARNSSMPARRSSAQAGPGWR
jgi:Fe-Mn family superoxide dismutase